MSSYWTLSEWVKPVRWPSLPNKWVLGKSTCLLNGLYHCFQLRFSSNLSLSLSSPQIFFSVTRISRHFHQVFTITGNTKDTFTTRRANFCAGSRQIKHKLHIFIRACVCVCVFVFWGVGRWAMGDMDLWIWQWRTRLSVFWLTLASWLLNRHIMVLGLPYLPLSRQVPLPLWCLIPICGEIRWLSSYVRGQAESWLPWIITWGKLTYLLLGGLSAMYVAIWTWTSIPCSI